VVQSPLLARKAERDHDHQKLRQRRRINEEQDRSDPGVCRRPQDDARPAITENRIDTEKHVIDRRESDGQEHVVENRGDEREKDEQPARNQSGGDAKITSAFAIELTEDENARTRQRA